MSKKIIGLTEPSSFTAECVSMIEDFFEANPLKLCHQNEENLEYWLKECCDAVVLAGGNDIHPRAYGGNILTDHGFSKFDLNRDIRELRVLNYCSKHNIPVFGICRGHQMLGIWEGMQLLQDLAESHIIHSPQRNQITVDNSTPIHSIRCLNGYKPPIEKQLEIFHITDREKKDYWVNSFHHQAILYNPDKIPDGVEVMATAEAFNLGADDNEEPMIIEMVEIMRGKNWLSCQFHPEADWQHNAISRDILGRFKEMVHGQK